MRQRRTPAVRKRRDPLARQVLGVRKDPVLTCPNTPQCPHAGLMHDFSGDREDPQHTCVFDHCVCGKPVGSQARTVAELLTILEDLPLAGGPESGAWLRSDFVPRLLEWAAAHGEGLSLYALSAFAEKCRTRADQVHFAGRQDGMSGYWRFAQQAAEDEVARVERVAREVQGDAGQPGVDSGSAG